MDEARRVLGATMERSKKRSRFDKGDVNVQGFVAALVIPERPRAGEVRRVTKLERGKKRDRVLRKRILTHRDVPKSARLREDLK